MKNSTILLTIIICLSMPIMFNMREGAGNGFSIKEYWGEGSTLIFEEYFSYDSVGSEADFEERNTVIYSYMDVLNDTNAHFNYTKISPPRNFTFAQFNTNIENNTFLRISDTLDPGDEIDYSFIISGGFVEFYILTDDQYNTWYIRYPFPSENITAIHTDKGANGTLKVNTTDQYYFVWLNDGELNNNATISIQALLDARFTEKTISEIIEIDPITLETTEGVVLDDFGMDTSEWELNIAVLIEIDDRDVYFNITREENILLTFNNQSVKVSCWVLAIEDYERSFLDEETYTVNADLFLWKSKISGITLKTIADINYYDESSTLLAMTYDQITIKTAKNVILTSKSSSPSLTIIVVILGLIGMSIISIHKRK